MFQGRAKQLYKAGYKTLQSIAKSKPEEIMDKVEHLPRRVVSQIISAAKVCNLVNNFELNLLRDTFVNENNSDVSIFTAVVVGKGGKSERRSRRGFGWIRHLNHC